LRKRIDDLGLHDRVLAPPVPMASPQRAADADIGINFPAACLNTRYCLPNKLFEYMMAGLAVIASDLPEMRNVVGRELGVVFDPVTPRHRQGDPGAGPRRSALRCKANALAAARTTYNWEMAQRPLLAAYAALEP
jgi:glycosyltransferase involved in cell wall biosynthesis